MGERERAKKRGEVRRERKAECVQQQSKKTVAVLSGVFWGSQKKSKSCKHAGGWVLLLLISF